MVQLAHTQTKRGARGEEQRPRTRFGGQEGNWIPFLSGATIYGLAVCSNGMGNFLLEIGRRVFTLFTLFYFWALADSCNSLDLDACIRPQKLEKFWSSKFVS